MPKMKLQDAERIADKFCSIINNLTEKYSKAKYSGDQKPTDHTMVNGLFLTLENYGALQAWLRDILFKNHNSSISYDEEGPIPAIMSIITTIDPEFDLPQPSYTISELVASLMPQNSARVTPFYGTPNSTNDDNDSKMSGEDTPPACPGCFGQYKWF